MRAGAAGHCLLMKLHDVELHRAEHGLVKGARGGDVAGAKHGVEERRHGHSGHSASMKDGAGPCGKISGMGLKDWFRGRRSASASETSEEAVDPQELFVREFEARLVALPEVEAVARVAGAPMQLSVRARSREVMTMYLGNLFFETREVDPEGRERLITNHLRSATQEHAPADTWHEAQALLVVALRGPLLADPEDHELAGREVAPCLREHLVLDGAHDMTLVFADMLERWGVTFEQAAAVGRARLAQAEQGTALYDGPQRIWTVEIDDDYESSRLLIPGFLASFTGRVDGRPIAVAPTRDQIYIAGDQNPAVVLRLCDLAEREYAASPRRVSAAIYTVVRQSQPATEACRATGSPLRWGRSAQSSPERTYTAVSRTDSSGSFLSASIAGRYGFAALFQYEMLNTANRRTVGCASESARSSAGRTCFPAAAPSPRFPSTLAACHRRTACLLERPRSASGTSSRRIST